MVSCISYEGMSYQVYVKLPVFRYPPAMNHAHTLFCITYYGVDNRRQLGRRPSVNTSKPD